MTTGSCHSPPGFGIRNQLRTIYGKIHSLEFLMRGAGLRLNNDVRRIWRCAACGAERKIGAQVTAVNCQCAGRPAMKLIETMRHERPLKELAATYMEFEFEPGELAPPRPRQEEEAPAPNSDTKLDFEMPAGRTTEGAGGDDATPPEGDARRSAPSSAAAPPPCAGKSPSAR